LAITINQHHSASQRAAEMIHKSHITITQVEIDRIEVADFGLGAIDQVGAEILTIVETSRLVVKVLVLFPGQILPEHRHPRLGDYPGKEETLRCAWGELYVNVPGEAEDSSLSRPPDQYPEFYSARREKILLPGDQVTFLPDTPHWFQGGPQGAVFWSFTTTAYDLDDVFTDPQVHRQTIVRD
jgi:D-lyxose ketol-isomerase